MIGKNVQMLEKMFVFTLTSSNKYEVYSFCNEDKFVGFFLDLRIPNGKKLNFETSETLC